MFCPLPAGGLLGYRAALKNVILHLIMIDMEMNYGI